MNLGLEASPPAPLPSLGEGSWTVWELGFWIRPSTPGRDSALPSLGEGG